MESSRGSPMVTPAPRRNARLGMYFFEMNIIPLLLTGS
jgi:hypothetical protein